MTPIRFVLVRSSLSLFALIVLALAAGVYRADAASPTIRIGVSLGLSGSYENIARMQQRAYRLWEKQVNQSGGILTRKVQLDIRDDKSDPEVAKQIYQDFIQKDELDFVFGPYSSPITSAVAPIADKHGYPMLVAGASADEIWSKGYTFIIGVYSTAGRYAVGFLALLADAGIERVAVVSVDDVFSLSAADGARKWAPQYGLRITAYIVQPKNKPDLVHAASAARQSGAQALVLSGHFNEAVEMRHALKKIGWVPSAYYSTVGPALPKYLDQLGKDAHATFFTSLWEPREDLRFPGSAAFLREFLAAYEETPSYQAATAYAAGQILKVAIEKAGSTDRAAVRQTLFALDTNSIIGRYAVDRTGTQVKGVPLIIQWQQNRREIVWPPDFRTAAPILNK
jgi:branched-chain amino acid transport system substrate-binding protein